MLSLFNPNVLPIDEEAFCAIWRGTPVNARHLASCLTEEKQALLALFCNSRSHLREHGREIAKGCDRGILVQIGGAAGQLLAEQINAGPENWGLPPNRMPGRVSLAASSVDKIPSPPAGWAPLEPALRTFQTANGCRSMTSAT
jgi:hypothetical protein